MKLKVLGGAKEGAEIPLKKDQFLIGRSKECTLRAGSEAISRKHCLIALADGRATIRDLGSRNGTIVNEKKIGGETSLNHGDEIQVGPLKFRFEAAEIKSGKQPKVANVADAVGRAASQAKSTERGSEGVFEDDISKWLIGPSHSDLASNETQTMQLDETRAAGLKSVRLDQAAAGEPETLEEEDLERTLAGGEDADDQDAQKKAGKKQPGKLPPLPPKSQAKDSREAAADILRQMSRRR
ncbi:Oxoglutarate dehydrogenase inhibitor [Pirellulimonas nuda]|uniref:Oxoglutarate dehydrogenase inhibitor n=1 Tax=Pirellulimonas nuda TaxID=2528009 RepID=A0A518D7N9_9BACT|nr:FHA domain-containing protein [Pirellulimonas nuda]QDU87498.1 Oxoglutarate dehydrogenase inhibitor [Pirellulimonas nuda]